MEYSGISNKEAVIRASCFMVGSSEKSSQKCFHGLTVKRKKSLFLYLDKIDEGSTSIVRKAKCQECGRFLAVKEYRCLSIMSSCVDNEIKCLEYIKENPNLNFITCFGFIRVPSFCHFVFECADMTLEKYLNEKKDAISIFQFNNIMFQLCSMLSHLDKIHLHHKDFRSANMVVFKEHNVIKLIDFGSSVMRGDERYTSPLDNTAEGAYILMNTQLDMKYKHKCTDLSECSDEYFMFAYIKKETDVTADTLLSQAKYWLPELSYEAKQFLVDGCSNDLSLRRRALEIALKVEGTAPL